MHSAQFSRCTGEHLAQFAQCRAGSLQVAQVNSSGRTPGRSNTAFLRMHSSAPERHQCTHLHHISSVPPVLHYSALECTSPPVHCTSTALICTRALHQLAPFFCAANGACCASFRMYHTLFTLGVNMYCLYGAQVHSTHCTSPEEDTGGTQDRTPGR